MSVGTTSHDVVLSAGLLATNDDAVELEFWGKGMTVQYSDRVNLRVTSGGAEQDIGGIYNLVSGNVAWHIRCHARRVSSTSIHMFMYAENYGGGTTGTYYNDPTTLSITMANAITFDLSRDGSTETVEVSKATAYIQ